MLRRRAPQHASPDPPTGDETETHGDDVIDLPAPVRNAYNPLVDLCTWLLVAVFAAGQVGTYNMLRRAGYSDHVAGENASLLVGMIHCFFTIGTSFAAMRAPGWFSSGCLDFQATKSLESSRIFE